jgi:hypothetical protein
MIRCAELFGTPRALARDLAVATGLGVLFGVLGPFGSFYAGPLELRIAFWVANIWLGFLLLSSAVRLSLKAGARWEVPVWFVLPAGVAAAAVPLSILVDLFSAHFWPGGRGRLGPVLEGYGQTLAIAEPCALLFYMLEARRSPSADAAPVAPVPTLHAPAASAPAPVVNATGRLEDRLSGRVGRELLCLQMEDHYVRAHTPRGSELVLLPLKEAVAELGHREGLQVHRSWWVARAAVAEAVRDGRNLRLRLVNGVEAPVSRASLPVLREAGWLDEASFPAPS